MAAATGELQICEYITAFSEIQKCRYVGDIADFRTAKKANKAVRIKGVNTELSP